MKYKMQNRINGDKQTIKMNRQKLDQQTIEMEKNIGGMTSKMERLDKIIQQTDRMDQQTDRMNQKVDQILEKINLQKNFNCLEHHVKKMERKFDKKLDFIYIKLGKIMDAINIEAEMDAIYGRDNKGILKH